MRLVRTEGVFVVGGIMTAPTLLALDMSSVAIGYVVRNSRVLQHGTIELNAKDDIAARCADAAIQIRLRLKFLADDGVCVDAVVIEAPVARFAKAVIPQARLSGAVLAEVARAGYLWLELPPSSAKFALCKDGTASKYNMLMAAAPHFGYDLDALTFRAVRGKWVAYTSQSLVYGEDAADALGLALAAQGRVRVEAML